ncbi:MAG: histidine phosphatase family protein [Lachnospiraceae bacterium]|nr:histidine phosphatase family protein [Lachnospiraceae bacterium]
MRIIFVRHGDPDYENDRLTEEGKLQAEATAKRLKDEGITRILSSPMGRACETASYTADLLGLPIEKLDFMHEIRWGNPTGDEIMREGHPWTLGYKLFCESRSRADLEKWREHPYFKENKCVEYYDMIADKMDKLMEELGYVRKDGRYYCVRENRETIAIFSHGGSGACALSHLLDINFIYMIAAMTYGLCSVSVVNLPADVGLFVVPRIELYNDMAHVPAAKYAKVRFDAKTFL